jgi:hypothetical protein
LLIHQVHLRESLANLGLIKQRFDSPKTKCAREAEPLLNSATYANEIGLVVSLFGLSSSFPSDWRKSR